MKKAIGLFILALLAQSSAHAQVAAKCKQILSLDVPITASGTYCMSRSLTGTGLVIDASDVRIDMRGYSIINSQVAQGGSYFTSTSQVGIRSENDANISIQNGNVSGFDYGVRIGHPYGARGTVMVANMLIRNSKQTGIDVAGYGEVTVANNIVSDTIGPVTFGMQVVGVKKPASEGGNNDSVVTVDGNRVNNTRSQGTIPVPWRGSTGIIVGEGGLTFVSNNIVTDVSTSDPSFQVTGLHVHGRHPYVVNIVNNTILNSSVLNNSVGLLATQGGTPLYPGDGPLGVGLVSGTKLYGYYYGVFGQSDIWVNGVQTFVRTITFSNNVVSGADAIRAYLGGILGKANRIE
jgi:hypothetical protein